MSTNDISDEIAVTSHVGRDLLQSAAVFRHERLVVWEYVSNGLEYVDPGTNPVVRVQLDSSKRRMSITDNGRGMAWNELRRFFVMHGENIDRKMGRPGRGFFGTGKAAAFGVGGVLRVTTVRNGLRSRVELPRSAIESMNSGDPIPVRTLERETPTDLKNGTIVEIEDIYLKKFDQASVIRYVERHISRWPNALVLINNHPCEFAEPPIASEFRFKPEAGTQSEALGDVTLVIKVAKTALDEDLQGVAIFSNGVWHETTLAGSERKDMSQFMFGELDVPRLGLDKSPIPAFDLSRSMQLNRSNELVRSIFAFVGMNIEKVRRELVEAERKRKASEEAKRLEKQASEIERIINDDFHNLQDRFQKVRARVSGARDLYQDVAPAIAEDDCLTIGGDTPAKELSETGGIGRGDGRRSNGSEPPSRGPEIEPSADEPDASGRPAKTSGERKRSRGGFAVEFREIGEKEARAKYERDDRTIYVNLDHPQLKAALGLGGVENVAFRRLSYEVAFAEYAMALARERAALGQYLEPDEPIIEVRDTLDRVTRAAASLYGT